MDIVERNGRLKERYYECDNKGHKRVITKECTVMDDKGKKYRVLGLYCEHCFRYFNTSGLWPPYQESLDFFEGISEIRKKVERN